MLKFGNKEFRNIQEQVEKNAKDIEKLIEEGVPGTGSELPTEKPTDNGQILLGNINGSVEWSTETIREFQHELVSGENIKTINGVSILGSGNIQIEGGGSKDNVVEIADGALRGHSTINPYTVDEATLTKLQDPNTIIKYNGDNYYNSELLGNNIILYKGFTTISNNTAYGTCSIFYNIINVRTVADNYGTGLWYTIETVFDVPSTLGTTYTEDGDYIWVAKKSGDSADSAWQKYTPGSGNNVVVELTNLAYSSTNPTVVDEATMQKLKDPNTIIKYENKFYYCHKITTSNYDTIIEYKTPVTLNTFAASGDAVFNQDIINVRTEGSTSAFKLGVWTRIDLVRDVPTKLPSTDKYAEYGDYVWVANKTENLTTYDWKKYTPGSGGSVDLSNYYTKTEADNQFTANTVFNTTTMGINAILDDIPKTYATKTTVNDLETQLRQEISGIDSRVTTLENAGGTGGNFNPQDPVTDDGQILIGNVDGTYSWSTQTIQELWDTADTANTTATTATNSITALDTRVTALENAGGSGGASYTFTNGLTESNGTVSWDLNDTVKVNSTYKGEITLYNKNIYPYSPNHRGVGLSIGGLKSSYINYVSTPVQARAAGSLAVGYNDTSTAQRVITGENAYGSLAVGYINNNNQIATEAPGTFAGGYQEYTTDGIYANYSGSFVWGQGNKSDSIHQVVFGQYNAAGTDKIFIVGNGVYNARSNAFTIDGSGNVVAAGTVSPSGADYAEYFEFEDGNPNKEDRIGYLVELAGNKIRFANGVDILGATSGTKCVIGDAEEMNWHGKYEKDEFGRIIYEEIEAPKEITKEDGTVETVYDKLITKKISADYDSNKTYIPRSDRPEWSPVGLLGKVLVRQDGTLAVGDYVKAINGIATKSGEKTNIRVLEVVSESIVKLLIK